MANLRAIRMRIKSVESTRQITRSMKMVAAAKLRKTQISLGQLREFADRGRDMLGAMGTRGKRVKNPLLLPRKTGGKRCYVLLVGNRGLCGTYNHSLLRYLEELRAQDRESLLWVLGRWGRDQIRGADRRIEISDTPDAEEARALTEELKQLYLEGGADEIVLVYQQFRSVLQQSPCAKTLLPLELPEGERDRRVIYEPDAETVLDRLTELVLQTTVRAFLLEGRTCEHAARMTAMTSASDNTEELIAELTLELNHARQAAITTEISEIVGGAAAL
jgi:F-type H+-transporting ATPase subunit gamma